MNPASRNLWSDRHINRHKIITLMNADQTHLCEMCAKEGFLEEVMFNLGLENDLGLPCQLL